MGIIIGAINLTGVLPMVYFILLYLIPIFWESKKYLRFVTGSILILILSAVLRFVLVISVIHFFGKIDNIPNQGEIIFQFLIGGFFILLIASPLRIFDVYIQKIKLENQLKTQKLEAELRFLKTQVNPHFLFNALNNIYSLSFTQSKQTPEMILRLSEMMSFMLYDCREKTVALSSEISYLKNYLSLRQLQKDGEQKIVLDVEGSTKDILISPMLFIPFYENAFKHGNMENINQAFLYSKFRIKGKQLSFTIKNTISIHKKKYAKGGVGLKNILDRLQLTYANQHRLEINETDNLYTVILDLDLTNPN